MKTCNILLGILFSAAFFSCKLKEVDELPELPEFEVKFTAISNQYSEIHGVTEALDGGFVISGHQKSNNGVFNNLIVIKTNDKGVVTKTVTEFGQFLDFTDNGAMTKLADGYAIIGTERSSDNDQIVVIKLNKDLTVAWLKKYGRPDHYEEAGGIEQTSQGDLIVAASNGTATKNADPFFVKIRASDGMMLDSQTVDVSGFGCYYAKSIVRNGGAFGVLGYNRCISISQPFFMKIDENLNPIITSKSLENAGNNSGVIVQSGTDGFVHIEGISAQAIRRAWIVSLTSEGEQISKFDQFLDIPDSGFLGGSRAGEKYVPCGWATNNLGTDSYGIAALIDKSFSTEARYEYKDAGKYIEFTASAGVSDGGYVLAGTYDNQKQVLLVKLNKDFKVQ